MPRLNAGTILENFVVLAATRLALDALAEDDALSFATAFAMPPLTQCWARPGEAGVRLFGYDHVVALSRSIRPLAPGTLPAFWALCVANSVGAAFHAFQDQQEGKEQTVYPCGGPNGALLAAMLAAQRGQPIYVWANDNGARYGRPTSETLDTVSLAGAFVGAEVRGTATELGGHFPHTVAHLREWLQEGDGHAGSVRLGFLDPDNYAEGTTQVTPRDHVKWLMTLAEGTETALSCIFSSCQNRGVGNQARNRRLASFHGDAVALYPLSLMFEHGNFLTGVKIRWPPESIHEVASRLIQDVQNAWYAWGTVAPLTVHVNGVAAA